ncbi:hypothetical protein [Halobiforma nitratireducens]|uniref:DUF8135 domain-containing protein n=1 Tax=Halobiforma nitratireducens JCM 10879 TaxID=1227454 RepID=M0LFZ0_9EURY|nr:hypothetical protein [Halobiforma nitratireducens]EMA31369.1 hypothetical protein C446_15418 [Halobiforma nitratireducens JCM 10879]
MADPNRDSERDSESTFDPPSGADGGDGRDRGDDPSHDASVADPKPKPGEPLGDVAAAVERRRTEGASDAFELETDAEYGQSSASSADFDELFDREDVSDLDREQLWDQLEDGSEPEDLFADEREIRTVDKREYCHQCEHFATPPNVGCTREGTDVLGMPSLGKFRVADCPVVLEDEELEQRY